LIERTGQPDFVKVLDFGVAKLIRPLLDSTAPGTLAGAIIGTPSFMSPEQASGGAVDWRADIYAVGALLYTVLAGHPPFDGDNLGSIVLQIVKELPPLLPEATARGELVPDALRDLIDSCLAKDPGARPQSMEALAEALSPFELEPTMAPEAPAPTWRWMAAGVVLALALGGGAWAWVERGEPSTPAPPPTRVRTVAPAPEPVRPPATPPPVALQQKPEQAFERDTGGDSTTMMPKRPPDTRRPVPARKSEKTRDAVLNPYAE
jgi:hypothetical protein